jgi:hypothetical protein
MSFGSLPLGKTNLLCACCRIQGDLAKTCMCWSRASSPAAPWEPLPAASIQQPNPNRCLVQGKTCWEVTDYSDGWNQQGSISEDSGWLHKPLDITQPLPPASCSPPRMRQEAPHAALSHGRTASGHDTLTSGRDCPASGHGYPEPAVPAPHLAAPAPSCAWSKGSEDLFFKVEIPEAATADRVFLFVNAWSCFLFFILFYAHTSGSAREFDTVLRTALPRKRKSCIRWLKMFCTPFMHPRVTPPVQKCNLVCGMFAILRVFS